MNFMIPSEVLRCNDGSGDFSGARRPLIHSSHSPLNNKIKPSFKCYTFMLHLSISRLFKEIVKSPFFREQSNPVVINLMILMILTIIMIKINTWFDLGGMFSEFSILESQLILNLVTLTKYGKISFFKSKT